MSEETRLSFPGDVPEVAPIVSSNGETGAGGYGPARNWAAHLDLGFVPRNGRTVLGRMDFHGPLRVQRSFYPEGEVCHTYLLHPPGGLVSGDELAIRAEVAPGAHALLTTPSAGKVYGTDSCNVRQGQKVELRAEDGTVEWLPMETIVFNGANAVLSTRVELGGKACAAGWEIVCFGRPEGDDLFQSGRLEQRLEIFRDARPLLIEGQIFEGGTDMMSSACGLDNCTVTGTMFSAGWSGDSAPVLEKVRALSGPDKRSEKGGRIASTFRRGVLVTRYLGNSAEEARSLFAGAWSAIRPELVGREACPPRIWTT